MKLTVALACPFKQIMKFMEAYKVGRSVQKRLINYANREICPLLKNICKLVLVVSLVSVITISNRRVLMD